MNSLSKLKQEYQAEEDYEQYKKWAADVQKTAVTYKPAWIEINKLQGRPTEMRILETPDDMPGKYAIGFIPGKHDNFAQIILRRYNNKRTFAYVKDKWYMSRACACAIEQKMLNQLYDDFFDIYCASTTTVSDDVIQMCKRHAKKYGPDATIIEMSLICVHYGMVAEENFNNKNPRIGKLLKLYSATRLIQEHVDIDTVTTECLGKRADEILKDCKRLSLPQRV